MSKSKVNAGLAKLLNLFQRGSGATTDDPKTNTAAEGASVRLADAFEGITAVRRVLGERSRLVELAEAELQRETQIRRDIEEADGRRIRAIADSRVSGSSEADPTLDQIATQRQRLETEMADCKKVAEDLRNRASALDEQLDVAVHMYRGDLGAFLNRMYEGAALQFNASAEETARAAVECISIQKTMIRFLAGNPNGFEQRIFLPRADPGNGRDIKPIIDSAERDFEKRISSRSTEIIELMREAGFSYRFDRTPT